MTSQEWDQGLHAQDRVRLHRRGDGTAMSTCQSRDDYGSLRVVADRKPVGLDDFFLEAKAHVSPLSMARLRQAISHFRGASAIEAVKGLCRPCFPEATNARAVLHKGTRRTRLSRSLPQKIDVRFAGALPSVGIGRIAVRLSGGRIRTGFRRLNIDNGNIYLASSAGRRARARPGRNQPARQEASLAGFPPCCGSSRGPGAW